MDFVRTPESRFKHLPDYPYEPHYIDVGGLRMHYVDEGPHDAAPILMLHGEPSWSFLYRRMIALCAAAGHRVVAPDLIGFGKSDKPVERFAYSYRAHLDWLTSLLDSLALQNITLVCQDWGSLLGLRLVTAQPERFRAVVIGNGMLPTGEQRVPAAFHLWRAFSQYSPWFPISKIIASGTLRSLSKDEQRAYDAPFPSSRYKVGARVFPKLVPTAPDTPEAQANREAWEVLKRWDKPFLTTFSNHDPITRGGDRYLQERIPGAHGMPHVTLHGGHFLQEDASIPFAQSINSLLAGLDKPR